MDNFLLAGIIIVVLVAAFVGLVVRQRSGRSKEVILAGPEVRGAGQGGRALPSAVQPERRARVEPPKPGRSRRPWSSKPAAEKPVGRLVLSDSAPVKEPRLTDWVVLPGTWLHSVYHGSRDGLAVRAATIRGTAHVHEGKKGQDAAGVAWNDAHRSLFAVVADGLGSRRESGEVALELVTQLMERAAEYTGSSTGKLVDQVIDSVRREVQDRELDGSTTMVMAEIRAAGGRAEVTVWGIGDSEAWLLRGGQWHPLHQERREDGENVTRHVPGHSEPRTRTVKAGRGDVIVLGSDGFTGALGGRRTPLGVELAARWSEPPEPATFLSHADFVHQYFYDDRSVVAVWIR
jgi:serine/threonine protein phosphatase PrpC